MILRQCIHLWEEVDYSLELAHIRVVNIDVYLIFGLELEIQRTYVHWVHTLFDFEFKVNFNSKCEIDPQACEVSVLF